VQQLEPKEFYASDFLENALVILHFHPPFSIAKKCTVFYMGNNEFPESA